MKVLFDVVYTASPAVCSTSYLVWELIDGLVQWRDDIFFYVTYPDNAMEDDDWEFISRHPDRVTLLPMSMSVTDRVAELFTLPKELRLLLVPSSSFCWDVDVVVSSRIPMLSSILPLITRAPARTNEIRAVIGLEEMPILSFRKTVPWGNHMEHTILCNYLNSLGVIINNQWTRKALKKVAKNHLTPSDQRRLLTKIREANPIKVARLNLKKETYNTGTDFNVVFCGRATLTRSFDKVVDVFSKQFSYPIGKNRAHMKFKVSTHSRGFNSNKFGETDFMSVERNNRVAYLEFLKDSHVCCNLSAVEDFSMTTYEALLAGVPVIVLNKPWTAFLGEDYPFRVNTMVEVYALLSAMAEDYDTQYARFKEWEQTTWKDYVEGGSSPATLEPLIELLTQWETVANNGLVKKGAYYNKALELADTGEDELDLTTILKKEGSVVEAKLSLQSSPILQRTPSNVVLGRYVAELGYHYTNEVGIMRKSK